MGKLYRPLKMQRFWKRHAVPEFIYQLCATIGACAGRCLPPVRGGSKRGKKPCCILRISGSGSMVVKTNTPKVRAARKMVVELLLANHPKDCLSCQKSGDCELQKLPQTLACAKSALKAAHAKPILLTAATPALCATRKNVFFAGAAYAFAAMCRA